MTFMHHEIPNQFAHSCIYFAHVWKVCNFLFTFYCGLYHFYLSITLYILLRPYLISNHFTNVCLLIDFNTPFWLKVLKLLFFEISSHFFHIFFFFTKSKSRFSRGFYVHGCFMLCVVTTHFICLLIYWSTTSIHRDIKANYC